KIVKDEIFPIVNQVDVRVQNFEIQFLKEAAKFVGDFKSRAKEADESLAKQKALELEIERLLRAVVSQDIMSVVQNNSVVDTSDLQTELDRTKERFENCIIKKENEYAKLWNDDECDKGIIPTKIELTLEQSQQGVSNDALVIIEGVEELKRNVWIKGENKAALPTLMQKPGQYIRYRFSLRQSYALIWKPCQGDSLNLPDHRYSIYTIKRETEGIDISKTRRPQPRSNTKNDRVPSASNSSRSKNKDAEVEEHHRNLLLSKNAKHMSSACNNIKLDSQNAISKVVYAMCYPNLFMVRRLRLFQAYDRKSKASHQFRLEVYDKPFESEFTSFLVKTEGCETVIGFVLDLALTRMPCKMSALEEAFHIPFVQAPQKSQHSDSGFELTGFSDADYARCKDTFKSTSGGAQFLGKKLVSWSSKKQDCTTLLTAKAEYVSLSACCAQVLWMRTQLTDYGFHYKKIPIYCDSKSAIAISCNPVQHSRTKHIAVRYHFIKEYVEKGTIERYFVKMDYQLADLFTKALLEERFNYLVRRLGMHSLSPQ
nr:retrovirus-related Pol polyprotein from transposon TNT 1-94 [Tanacetum cinerariifolium]